VIEWDTMTSRLATALLATLFGLGGAAALPGSAIAAADRPQRVCRVGDDRLTEISGLAATPTGYVVVNDGSDDPRHRKIFFLDKRCSVVHTVSYPSRPRDTEDLARATDGTLWVADIGDNDRTRSTIALWQLTPGAKKPTLYRMTYPDGPHDAEALLLGPDGTPIVVTKTVGTATMYVPDRPVRAGHATPLRQAGRVTLPLTGTSNPFSLPGRLVVTGGAVSPDGRRAVLRTYADAFEFDVSGGDVVHALSSGKPRVIPLPDEPQGESVTYSPDGTSLLTISELGYQPAGTKLDLLRYALPDRPAAAPPTPSAPSTKASRSSKATPTPTPTAEAGRDGIATGAIAAGVLLIAAAGTFGVATARRRRSAR
jgi:hypothetical protein